MLANSSMTSLALNTRQNLRLSRLCAVWHGFSYLVLLEAGVLSGWVVVGAGAPIRAVQ